MSSGESRGWELACLGSEGGLASLPSKIPEDTAPL